MGITLSDFGDPLNPARPARPAKTSPAIRRRPISFMAVGGRRVDFNILN